ncbi:MAG: hypothetical protein RL077_1670 [Verrucomicrobiota bacterium]|jgi:hypothetical protein
MKNDPELALRYRGGDRHHLFNNNGTWFVRYCVREARWFKADRRLVASLRTKDLNVARSRRDDFFAHLRLHTELGQSLGLDWSEGRAA